MEVKRKPYPQLPPVHDLVPRMDTHIDPRETYEERIKEHCHKRYPLGPSEASVSLLLNSFVLKHFKVQHHGICDSHECVAAGVAVVCGALKGDYLVDVPKETRLTVGHFSDAYDEDARAEEQEVVERAAAL